jgi:hypothetical protein
LSIVLAIASCDEFYATIAGSRRTQKALDRFRQTTNGAAAGNNGNALDLSLIPITFHSIMVKEISEEDEEFRSAGQRSNGALVAR